MYALTAAEPEGVDGRKSNRLATRTASTRRERPALRAVPENQSEILVNTDAGIDETDRGAPRATRKINKA